MYDRTITRKVIVDLSGPRGTLRCPLGWTMSLLERAKAAPGRTRFQDGVVWFEKTEGNVKYMTEAFGNPGEPPADPREELSAKLKKQRPDYLELTTPDPQQKEAMELWNGKPLFAFFERPGVGKSKIILDALVRLWCDGKIDGAIIASVNVVHEQWVHEQIPTHVHPTIPVDAMAYRAGRKWDKSFVDPKPDKFRVLAVNHEALLSKGARPLVDQFSNSGRMAIVIDESHILKNPAGVLSSKLADRKDIWPYRYVATGEPTPQGLHDYYGQLRFLDSRIVRVQTYAGFKLKYCVMGGQSGDQVIGYHNTGELHQLMAPYVHVAELDLDVKQIYEQSKYSLSGTAARYYAQMRQDLIVELEKGGLSTAANQMVAMMRLQQIACGRLVRTDDPAKVEETFPTDRPDLLRSLLKIYVDKKVIIWNRYIADMDWQLDMLGGKAAVINGQVKKSDRLAIKQAFVEGDIQYLVASPAAAGTGLNVQGTCFKNIYYTNSDNAVHRWQSERRTYRRGTTQDVTYVDILCRNSVDIGIQARFRRKKTLSDLSRAEFRAILDGEGEF